MSNARDLARVDVNTSGEIAAANLANAVPADGSITTAKIADGAITSTKLASGAAISSGTVAYFGMSTAPTGWLKANGAAISRTTYADLFSAIGTTYGAGDGSTTFNVPDLRGEFPRGWDDGRGVDSGRVFGSSQTDDFKSHTHTAPGGSSPYSGYGGGGLFFVTYSHTTDATGGSETRPRNVALLACIKY